MNPSSPTANTGICTNVPNTDDTPNFFSLLACANDGSMENDIFAGGLQSVTLQPETSSQMVVGYKSSLELSIQGTMEFDTPYNTQDEDALTSLLKSVIEDLQSDSFTTSDSSVSPTSVITIEEVKSDNIQQTTSTSAIIYDDDVGREVFHQNLTISTPVSRGNIEEDPPQNLTISTPISRDNTKEDPPQNLTISRGNTKEDPPQNLTISTPISRDNTKEDPPQNLTISTPVSRGDTEDNHPQRSATSTGVEILPISVVEVVIKHEEKTETQENASDGFLHWEDNTPIFKRTIKRGIGRGKKSIKMCEDPNIEMASVSEKITLVKRVEMEDMMIKLSDSQEKTNILTIDTAHQFNMKAKTITRDMNISHMRKKKRKRKIDVSELANTKKTIFSDLISIDFLNSPFHKFHVVLDRNLQIKSEAISDEMVNNDIIQKIFTGDRILIFYDIDSKAKANHKTTPRKRKRNDEEDEEVGIAGVIGDQVLDHALDVVFAIFHILSALIKHKGEHNVPMVYLCVGRPKASHTLKFAHELVTAFFHEDNKVRQWASFFKCHCEKVHQDKTYEDNLRSICNGQNTLQKALRREKCGSMKELNLKDPILFGLLKKHFPSSNKFADLVCFQKMLNLVRKIKVEEEEDQSGVLSGKTEDDLIHTIHIDVTDQEAVLKCTFTSSYMQTKKLHLMEPNSPFFYEIMECNLKRLLSDHIKNIKKSSHPTSHFLKITVSPVFSKEDLQRAMFLPTHVLSEDTETCYHIANKILVGLRNIIKSKRHHLEDMIMIDDQSIHINFPSRRRK